MTTVCEPASDGHEVTVLERLVSLAAEARFAKAGVLAPGYVTPGAVPSMPMKVIRHLLSRQAPVRGHAGLSTGEVAWLWRWWQACRMRTFQAHRLRMQRPAHSGRGRPHRVMRELKPFTALGPRFELFDAAQCRVVEPGLSEATALHGGVCLPTAEVGNCRQFTTLLRAEAQRAGVRFRFHTQVRKIVAGSAPQLVNLCAPPHESTVLTAVAAERVPRGAQDTQQWRCCP